MIDLHIHSTASDGTDTIPELLKKIRDTGITTFSVTDHDTIDGALEMEKLVPDDMTFIKGIEFSCITEAGKCHILGFGYKDISPAFNDALKEAEENRRMKNERRIAFLADNFGIILTDKDLEELNALSSITKPHFGNLLVKKGLAPDKNTAIEKYLEPCKTDGYRLDGVKMIRAILDSGGVPVWAHPFGGTDEDEVPYDQFKKQFRCLCDAGLKGLECYYSKYNKDEIDLLLKGAFEHGLAVSGGSDYHGTNKDVTKVSLGKLNSLGEAVADSEITVVDLIK